MASLPRTALAALVLGLATACSDPSGPGDDVATVHVEPVGRELTSGETVQLTAEARNTNGQPVDGGPATWNSSDDEIASVSATGLLTARATGSTLITATIDGHTGSTTVTVVCSNDVPVAGTLAPGQLTVGGGATLTGTNLLPCTRVFVNGVRASASAINGGLQFTVPCVVAGPASITLQNSSQTSAPVNTTVSGGSTQTLAPGEFTLLSSPMCLQLGASAATERYLIGVQSISQTHATLTPVTFGIDAGGTATTVAALETENLFRAQSLVRTLPTLIADDGTAARWRAHRNAEHALRTRELTQMNPRFADGQRAMRQMAAYSATANAMQAVEVGDTLQLHYPDPERNLCTDFDEVTGIVQHISTHGIFVADTANPTNGYLASDYENFGNLLDDRIYATNAAYFGAPTDMDGNGRIIVLFTREVNEREGILGMVVSADLFPRTGTNSCPSSNEGEIYYGRAPDPAGDVGAAYPLAQARLDAPSLIAHELTHIIQFGRRLEFPGATSFQQLWELESQATLAEEVVGHDFTNRQVRQNYGFDVAWENCREGDTGIAWYCDKFGDLALYYGFIDQNTRADGAPEQCSWIGRPDEDDGGPCIPQRMVYTGWSFLRWLSDHYGPALGGEQVLHQRLIENTQTGFATISEVIGQPIDQLLGRWAATLYTDDRFADMEPLLTLPSWNLFDIEQGLRENARLDPYRATFTDYARDVSVRAGSSAYFLVTGSRSATAVRATTQTGASLPSHMRMWIVRVE